MAGKEEDELATCSAASDAVSGLTTYAGCVSPKEEAIEGVTSGIAETTCRTIDKSLGDNLLAAMLAMVVNQ